MKGKEKRNLLVLFDGDLTNPAYDLENLDLMVNPVDGHLTRIQTEIFKGCGSH